ncbi:MAG: hypothetical protein HY923_07480 [Elusimicrobia bacterium]|nr:hypothetical protein [Elusimicrobiota bacterium]
MKLFAALAAVWMCSPAFAATEAYAEEASLPHAVAKGPEAPAPSTAPVGPSVALLTQRFTGATKDSDKTLALQQIAKTAPVSGQDISNLYDLFARFSDPYTRGAIMESLGRLGPGHPQLEPLFMTYLRQPEPDAQLFGVNGAFRLRARAALPLIREIAGRRFAARETTETNMGERNAWWTQYEALSVLAQWEGDKAYDLVSSKGLESAKVGAILGRYYWRQTLPRLKAWSASGELIATERAALAVSAQIDLADAKATRPGMIALLRDPKVDTEIRHNIALKVGLSSSDEEVEALVAEHDKTASPDEKLYWAAAIFVSRSQKAVPLLVRYARQTENETMRTGALAQLKDMLGDAEAQALIEPEKKK